MFFKYLVLVVSVLHFVQSASLSNSCSSTFMPPDPASGCCGIDASGGKKELLKLFPWLAQVEYTSHDDGTYNHFCNGALISGVFVLTSARCVSGLPKHNLTSVLLGEYDKSNEFGSKDCVNQESGEECTPGAFRIPIQSYTAHPQYKKRTHKNDIALIKLEKTVPYTDYVRPLCLPSSDITINPPENLNLVVAGWGVLQRNDDNIKPFEISLKRHITPPFWTSESCKVSWQTDIDKETQICTGGDGSSTCTGDSGLPVMYEDEDSGVYQAVGVVNFGPSCTVNILRSEHQRPDVSTKVFAYKGWIDEVMAKKKEEQVFNDKIGELFKDTAETNLSVHDNSCGRRKIDYTELITNGLLTKPGYWPWHVAIYKLNNATFEYTCGGTLVSKSFVVTAAHCASVRGVPLQPEILRVFLGKYNLIGRDLAVQEREVLEIILHEEYLFAHYFDNDVALLKLKSEATFNDYVQPACLWSSSADEKMPPGIIFGTVVGWGLDHTDKLSAQLDQATIPKIEELTCIKSNPVFFGRTLNERKFCAGLNNGTSACNGDSGGGFHVFVPDTPGDTASSSPGAWYVRGVTSMAVARRNFAVCDPSQYVLFTDLAKFRGWLMKYVK